MTFCTKDMWSGGEAWMGCRGRGIADGLQTFASRHKDGGPQCTISRTANFVLLFSL